MNANILSDKVLNAIPYDDWIPASEIASNLGERSIDVAWIITNKLLNKYVERMRSRKQTSPYLYRRLKRCARADINNHEAAALRLIGAWLGLMIR